MYTFCEFKYVLEAILKLLWLTIELVTEIKRRPSDFKTEEEIKAIQSKDNLTLKRQLKLLKISPLTFRRWIFVRWFAVRSVHWQ